MDKKTKYIAGGLTIGAIGALSYYIYKTYIRPPIPFTIVQTWGKSTCVGYCGGPYEGYPFYGADKIYQVYIKFNQPVNGYGIAYAGIEFGKSIQIHATQIQITNGEGTATFYENGNLFAYDMKYYYIVFNINGRTYKYDSRTNQLTYTNESAEFPYKATLTASSNEVDLCNPNNEIDFNICVTPKTFKSGFVLNVGSITGTNNCTGIGYSYGNPYNLPCVTENMTRQFYVNVVDNNNIIYEMFTNPVTVSVTVPKGYSI
jgi:hypothetical protein